MTVLICINDGRKNFTWIFYGTKPVPSDNTRLTSEAATPWQHKIFQELGYNKRYIKGHLSPFCAYAAVWFLIRRNTFQSWYMWEKSFSIDLMSLVEIVVPILENCLVGHDILKCHILFLEFKTVTKIPCPRKRIFKAARGKSYFIWSTWEKR